MADRANRSSAEQVVGSGRSTPPGNRPASPREALGQRLEELAKNLTSTYDRLKYDWPKEEEVAEYWRNGLEEVKNGVVRCQKLAEKCQAVIQDDKSQSLPDLARKQLNEAVKQFSTAIGLARRDTMAAIHALEVRQKPTARAGLYDKAVDQLAELSERCTGLATQMRGEKALPGR